LKTGTGGPYAFGLAVLELEEALALSVAMTAPPVPLSAPSWQVLSGC